MSTVEQAHLYAPLPDNYTPADIEAGVAAIVAEALSRGADSSTVGPLPKAMENCRSCYVINSGKFGVRFITAFEPQTGKFVARLDSFI